MDIATGASSAMITMEVLGDTIDEMDETFALSLSDACGVTLATGSATATIIDDDHPAPVSGLY